MKSKNSATRLPPVGIIVLTILMMTPAALALAVSMSLLLPGGLPGPIQQFDLRGPFSPAATGIWLTLLMLAVSKTAAVAAIGLWQGRRWAYQLSVAILTVVLAGELVKMISGWEGRSTISIPITMVLLAYLSRDSVRLYFSRGALRISRSLAHSASLPAASATSTSERPT